MFNAFGQAPAQQIQADPPMVAVNEVKISGSAMLHELMTRNGFYLPCLRSRYCTQKTLLKISEGEYWCLKQDMVLTRVCTRPPSVHVLIEKLHQYLEPHKLKTGISVAKENFPDKPWLIIAVATVSQGKDEIFGKDYIPSSEELRKNPLDKVMVHNKDGLLDIPPGLAAQYDKKGSRYIKMVTLSKEAKIQAQIALSEQRMKQFQEKQGKLKKELEKAQLAASGVSQRDIDLQEMRAELERVYQQQAQEFINQQI